MTGKGMSYKRPTLTELLEKREILLELNETIDKRLVYCSEEEALRVEALKKRALYPECNFARKHRLMLYALAVAPDRVSWIFKLRERIHRIFCC
jgi:hypothetical protein